MVALMEIGEVELNQLTSHQPTSPRALSSFRSTESEGVKAKEEKHQTPTVKMSCGVPILQCGTYFCSHISIQPTRAKIVILIL